MKIKEIQDLFIDSKCRNMLLCVLCDMKHLQLQRDFDEFIVIGLNNFVHPVTFNFGNFAISLARIPVDQVRSIWLRFEKNPDELAEIIQKLIQPFDGKVLVIANSGNHIFLEMEYDPDFVLENTNLYLAFNNYGS